MLTGGDVGERASKTLPKEREKENSYKSICVFNNWINYFRYIRYFISGLM